jgi:hypothetical protein
MATILPLAMAKSKTTSGFHGDPAQNCASYDV